MAHCYNDFAQSLRIKGQFHVLTNTNTFYKTYPLNASTNGNPSSILAIKRVNIILTDHVRRKYMTVKGFFLFSELFVHFTYYQ